MILVLIFTLELLLGQIMISKHAPQSFICRPFSKSHKILFDTTIIQSNSTLKLLPLFAWVQHAPLVTR
jgi:hypothetical protein